MNIVILIENFKRRLMSVYRPTFVEEKIVAGPEMSLKFVAATRINFSEHVKEKIVSHKRFVCGANKRH